LVHAAPDACGATDVDGPATGDGGAVSESGDSDTDGEDGAVSHDSTDGGDASTHDATDGGSAATATGDGGGAATEGGAAVNRASADRRSAAVESTAADRRRAVGESCSLIRWSATDDNSTANWRSAAAVSGAADEAVARGGASTVRSAHAEGARCIEFKGKCVRSAHGYGAIVERSSLGADGPISPAHDEGGCIGVTSDGGAAMIGGRCDVVMLVDGRTPPSDGVALVVGAETVTHGRNGSTFATAADW